ncbi:MAG: cation-transporting P-type ATPase, partial [Pantoea sp.]|nr:cation-transporting P-type ATPase [Pantoea sp.]
MSDMKLEQVVIKSDDHRTMKKTKKLFAIAREAVQPVDVTLANLRSDREGLTHAEAAARLKQYGPNEVAHEKAPPALIQLLMAFNNPFIYVLLVLALVSLFTDYLLPLRAGEETDLSGVIIISTMVLLSGLLRFWQEFRTNRAAQALKSLVRSQVTVLRRDSVSETAQRHDVDMRELVPGDVILLSTGDQVPADVRLLSSRNLFISEAVLTGESLPVEKQSGNITVDPHGKSAQELLALNNICLMGTSVASGTASAVVVATGGDTWFGSLAASLVGSRPQTAFDRGVNSVSRLLIRFMLVMVPVVLLINGFSKGDWMDATL